MKLFLQYKQKLFYCLKESQQHIIECTALNKSKKEQEELKYEKLMNGAVLDKVKLSRRLKENMKILEKCK
jgi:hypothetical protein